MFRKPVEEHIVKTEVDKVYCIRIETFLCACTLFNLQYRKVHSSVPNAADDS